MMIIDSGLLFWPPSIGPTQNIIILYTLLENGSPRIELHFDCIDGWRIDADYLNRLICTASLCTVQSKYKVTFTHFQLKASGRSYWC